MRKRYILFDLDGTLTDPMVGITKSAQYALKKFGIEVTDHKSLSFFIGPPLRDSFCQYYGMTQEEAGKAIQYYREYYKPIGIFENELYEGIEQMLIHLKKEGHAIVLATSKPEVFAKQILEYFQIETYFDFVAGSDLEETRVKKAEIIQYAMEQFPADSEMEVVMVGDRCYDIEGARQSGICAGAVTYGYGSVQELEKAKPDWMVATVKELEQRLCGDIVE
ncbi:5'-nucleotidase [Clostridiales bacterium CHKCI001]|nr:5'-nucleotidase [Clostridiales bacterium CHKCI001]